MKVEVLINMRCMFGKIDDFVQMIDETPATNIFNVGENWHVF